MTKRKVAHVDHLRLDSTLNASPESTSVGWQACVTVLRKVPPSGILGNMPRVFKTRHKVAAELLVRTAAQLDVALEDQSLEEICHDHEEDPR